MDRKLPWDEIKKRYPDEWVILVDLDVSETSDVTAGRVFDHGPSKRAMHQRLKDARGDVAILCTREPRGGVVASLGFARMVIEE